MASLFFARDYKDTEDDVPDDGGRDARKWKGTTRPPYIWPEVWARHYGKATKAKLTKEWAAHCKQAGTDWWGKPLKLGDPPVDVAGAVSVRQG